MATVAEALAQHQERQEALAMAGLALAKPDPRARILAVQFVVETIFAGIVLDLLRQSTPQRQEQSL